MRCDWSFNTDDHCRFSWWRNMRLNIQEMYQTFPFYLIFSNSPVYITFNEPSPRNPVEVLSADLLNSMEINLKNIYEFTKSLTYYPLNVILTKDISRRKTARGMIF